MENNDIELFCTTNVRTKEELVSRLVNGRISYLEKWEKIPFFRRREYNGAKELCVIYVNGNQWDAATGILQEYKESRGMASNARNRYEEEAAESKEAADDGYREDDDE